MLYNHNVRVYIKIILLLQLEVKIGCAGNFMTVY